MNTTISHFERLGLPRRFSIDLAELEAAYLKASRATHPDLQTQDSVEVRQEIQLNAARVNEAYFALKDPMKRAEYWLSLHGGPSAHQDKSQDQRFLMDMMELQEALEQALSDKNSARIDAIDKQLSDLLQQELQTIDRLLATSSQEQTVLLEVRKKLNAIRTITSLQRQVEFGREDHGL